jgi:hypothetical protein
MRPCDIRGNGQTESNPTALVLAARRLKPHKGLGGGRALRVWDAWAIIVHGDAQAGLLEMKRQNDLGAVAPGIDQKILNRPSNRHRP